MISKEKHIEVLSPKGEVLIRLKISESEATVPKNGNGNGRAASKEAQPPLHHNGEHMTDAQKKFLFRICADQGFQGDEAHNKLKELFGVASLQDVSKSDASKMIENLLAETKGGNGNGSSF